MADGSEGIDHIPCRACDLAFPTPLFLSPRLNGVY